MKLIREIKDRSGRLVFRRWSVLRLPWFSVFLHGMYAPEGDQDKHCHDHPWSFWTLVLWGGYREVVHDTKTHSYHVRRPGSLRFMPARGVYHRILELVKERSYSLVFASRQTQPWGYWTQNGWIENSRYRTLKASGALPLHKPSEDKDSVWFRKFISHLNGRAK
jgi:hypothetical protein